MITNSALDDRYNQMLERLIVEGVDVDLFYSNINYFNIAGRKNEYHKTCHPIIAHFPALGNSWSNCAINILDKLKKEFDLFNLGNLINWSNANYWHSTIATLQAPNPKCDIEDSSLFVSEILSKKIESLSAYLIIFDKIMVTKDGAILLLGYPSDNQCFKMRQSILSNVPSASAPNIIHITIGRILRQPNAEEIHHLKFICIKSFKISKCILKINVNGVSICRYQAPVLDPKLINDHFIHLLSRE